MNDASGQNPKNEEPTETREFFIGPTIRNSSNQVKTKIFFLCISFMCIFSAKICTIFIVCFIYLFENFQLHD
jgi:hypothetical protein